jgi:hypothetical protein
VCCVGRIDLARSDKRKRISGVSTLAGTASKDSDASNHTTPLEKTRVGTTTRVGPSALQLLQRLRSGGRQVRAERSNRSGWWAEYLSICRWIAERWCRRGRIAGSGSTEAAQTATDRRAGGPGGSFPQRPSNFEPYETIYPTSSNTTCTPCIQIYFKVRVTGNWRASHSRQGNERVYESRTGPNGPINSNLITRDMVGPNGTLRNPRGFVWHHPPDFPRTREIWLITYCQHRSPQLQPVLHPGGHGGYSRFRRRVGPTR